jgi:protocatechuate 3,4-dioxygenase beta subunit
MIEFWQADASGRYTDEQRATVIAGDDGQFEYKSDFPGRYESRPVHIHVKVSGQNVDDLITQLYPKADPADVDIDVDLVALERNTPAPGGYSTGTPVVPVR